MFKVLPKIDADERTLMMLDDDMFEMGRVAETLPLFIKMSDHGDITLMYMLPNVFETGQGQRPIALNSQNTDLFKNQRDEGQMRALSQEMFST